MSLLTVKDILVKKEAINLPSCTFGSFKCHQCRYFEQESVDSQGKSRCSYHYTWHLPNDGCGSAEPSDFYYEDEIADYEGKCGNCREAFVSDEKYCSFCGTKRGEGEFKPYRNIVQTLYGPAPKPYKHLCKSCGYTWGAVFMFDHQKYCPRCGGNVERLSDEQGEKRLLKKNKKVLVLAFGVAVIAILLLASILYFFTEFRLKSSNFLIDAIFSMFCCCEKKYLIKQKYTTKCCGFASQTTAHGGVFFILALYRFQR